MMILFAMSVNQETGEVSYTGCPPELALKLLTDFVIVKKAEALNKKEETCQKNAEPQS